MLVFEYKVKAKKSQYRAIDEAIRTVQFIRNKSISNGHHEPNPKFLKKSQSSIKHAQRQIYKKKKGSNNRRKARARYSRKHLRVSRQRNEHAKRLARNVCKSNDLVAYENLRVSNMLKNHCLAKSMADASWYLFRMWIDYFAAKFGKLAVAVPPHYTSQKCSQCQRTVKKSLSVRTHTCQCGCIMHRDTNAAINILTSAKSRDGQSQSNANGVGTSTLLGESLVEQVLTLKLESPHAQRAGSVNSANFHQPPWEFPPPAHLLQASNR